MTFCGEKSALAETRLRMSRPLKPARNRKDRSTLRDKAGFIAQNGEFLRSPVAKVRDGDTTRRITSSS
jgi:hypothetical protein